VKKKRFSEEQIIAVLKEGEAGATPFSTQFTSAQNPLGTRQWPAPASWIRLQPDFLFFTHAGAVADRLVIARQGSSHLRGVVFRSMRASLVLQLLVLRKALGVCGTEEALAKRLDVSGVALRGWLAGAEPVPLAVFNRAMQLVNGAYREEIAGRHLQVH
jgi:hypothetical protein